jgi:hypothetical protein
LKIVTETCKPRDRNFRTVYPDVVKIGIEYMMNRQNRDRIYDEPTKRDVNNAGGTISRRIKCPGAKMSTEKNAEWDITLKNASVTKGSRDETSSNRK